MNFSSSTAPAAGSSYALWTCPADHGEGVVFQIAVTGIGLNRSLTYEQAKHFIDLVERHQAGHK